MSALEETCTEFAKGTMVWARLRGYPHWPAIVISHDAEKERKGSQYVLFFGTKDHAWIKNCDLNSYDENYEKFSAAHDRRLEIAVKAAEQYKRQLPWIPDYRKCTEEKDKEKMRQNLLVFYSDSAIDDENENKRQNLKRKKAPCEDSTRSSQARKKPKMSPSENVKEKPKPSGKPKANVKSLVSKEHKKYSFAKNASKEPKNAGKQETNKADSKKNTSGETSARSCKASKEHKIAVPAKDSKQRKTADSVENSKKRPKRSIKTETNNKTGMEKRSSGRKSAQPRNTSGKHKMSASVEILRRGPKRTSKSQAFNKTGMEEGSSKGKAAQTRNTSLEPKTAAAAKNLRSGQKPTSKPEVFVKKCKILYMPSSGSTSVFPVPSISSRAFEIANGRIVFDTDMHKRTLIRTSVQPPLTLGFVGIGELAHTLVSRLVRNGMRVLVWNRSAQKCFGLVRRGAILADTPADVAAESDIVFCCVRGTGPIIEVCFGGLFVGLDGIVPGLKRNPRREKGFVMLSSIKPETSLIISQDFEKANTKYLEAQVLLKSRVKDCNIKILCAGNRSLYEILSSCFICIKVHFTFVSNMLGDASRLKYAHTIVHVGYSLSVVEALAVLQESENPVNHLNMILDELQKATFSMRNKVRGIVFRRRNLGDTIKELKDVLRELSDWYPKRPLSLATAALEAVEHAAQQGVDNRNVSAMCDLLI